MIGCAPGESLHRKGRVTRAARSHYRSAEDAEVRDFVREAPPIDHIGFSVVAHARAAVGVRGYARWVHRPPHHFDSAGGPVPLLHLSLREVNGAQFVLPGERGDAADRVAEGIEHRVVQIEEVVFVWKGGSLQMRGIPASRVLVDERLPA